MLKLLNSKNEGSEVISISFIIVDNGLKLTTTSKTDTEGETRIQHQQITN